MWQDGHRYQCGGDAVVVYSGKGPQDDQGIYARHFAHHGGSSVVVPVNQTTREDQSSPSVAIDEIGNGGSLAGTWTRCRRS